MFLLKVDIVQKSIFHLIFVVLLFLISSSFTNTFAYTNISDTISTSRPSASAPLVADQAASATQVTIYDNGSIFLASDSATLAADTGQTQNTTIVASMSAANTPSSGQRVVYFTGTPPANTHHAGTPIYTPITAMHTIAFTTQAAIPADGRVVINFMGSGNNTASPSASTFAFNGLNATGGLPSSIKTNNITCNASSLVAAPTITCYTSSIVSAGTTVTFLIGCNTNSGASCTAQNPLIINPTKTAAAGTADIWKVTIQSQDTNANGNALIAGETATVAMGIIESVQVQANVDPTLTFTITGIANGAAINTGNTTGCTNTEVTNTGIAATSTNVNLGTLSGGISIAAQRMNITTNASNGYTLTATSSGHLINPSNGYFLNDSTTPAFMTAGTTWFGIHACGQDVSSGTWGTGATGGGAGAKYGWPTQTTAVTLASDSSGPIDPSSSDGAGDGVVSTEYAATISGLVPGGIYTSVVTYVATPAF